MTDEARRQTLGAYRVGTDFNPGRRSDVDAAKEVVSDLIDFAEDVKEETENPEAKRCVDLAQTAFEEGAMWLVKAITKPERM